VSTISQFTRLPTKALLVSYQVAHRIAKSKNPHNLSEELILPAAVDHVRTMIGEGTAHQLELVTLYLMTCLKLNVWCCLQIYETCFSNDYYSSSRNILSPNPGIFSKGVATKKV